MYELILKNNKGFKWYHNDIFFVKGYFFDQNNNFYQNIDALNFLCNFSAFDDLIELVGKLNGVFTILFKKNETLFIASDKTRFFPIFYTLISDKYYISDSAFELINRMPNPSIDLVNAHIFKASGYTIDNGTLIKGIFSVKPAEWILFENNQIVKTSSFYSFAIENQLNSSYNELKEMSVEKLESSFKRLIVSLENKQVALPLSGGYDSRLIAVMLKKFNYQNVVCFTYGRKGNEQIENSRNAAHKLGFKWYFVEYNNELIKDYYNSELFRDYAKYAGKITSMPYLQEYFAVKYLKDNKLIESNAVFIPGHSGDLLGGSQFVKVFNDNVELKEVPEIIFKRKLFLNKINKNFQKEIYDIINKRLQNLRGEKSYIPYSLIEEYDIKEKIAKFIFNSSTVFDYFGYEVRFPYWDNELMDFFKALPSKYRISKRLYDDVLINKYFTGFKVNFKKELQATISKIIFQRIKDLIKRRLSGYIKKKILIKNDWCFHYPITEPMVKELDYKFKNVVKYNSIITIWYLDFLEKLIKPDS